MASLDEIKTLLEQINISINNAIVKQQISANQVKIVSGLSDISERLGLIQAGEFRVGNGNDPGFGFTGGRFGFPGFTYGTETYFLVGVNNDEVQVGLNISDGKIYAGGGVVVLDSNGISVILSDAIVDDNNYIYRHEDGTIIGGMFGSASATRSTGHITIQTKGVGFALTELGALGSSLAESRMTANTFGNIAPAGFFKLIQNATDSYAKFEGLNYIELSDGQTTNPSYSERRMYYNPSTHALMLAGGSVWERISNQPFASFYGLDFAQTQVAAQNTWYGVTHASIVTGKLNVITMHETVNGRLVVPTAGKYLVNWSLTMSASAANKHVRGGISVSGTVAGDGQAHNESTGTTEFTIGGTAILNLAVNDTIQAAFETIDAGNPTLEVHDVSVSVVRIGE